MLQLRIISALSVGLLAISLVVPKALSILLSPLWYLLSWLPILLFIGVLALSSNFGIGIILDRYYSHESPSTQPCPKPLLFSTPAAWQAAITRNQWSYKPPQSLLPIASSLPAVSKSIGDIMIFIVRDFVLRWYTDISSSPAFPTAVSSTLHSSSTALVERLSELDIPEFVVRILLPKLTAHVELFRESETMVRGAAVERHLTQSEELDILLASRYAGAGRLHPAVANLSTMSTRQSEEDYLRTILDKVLPLVLPESEAQSRVVVIAVREIVSCVVLAPLMDMLADPDFGNRMVEQFAGAAIQQQKMITKVRQVLEKGTNRSQVFSSSDPINLNTDVKQFELFLQSIARTNSLLDARRMKNDLSSEIRRTRSLLGDNEDHEWISGVKTETVVVYLERLYTAKRQVERRIGVLGGTDESQVTTGNLTEPFWRPSLRDLLTSASPLSYFMEFMDRRSRSLLVQFWLTVESFKYPLESVESALTDNENIPLAQEEPLSDGLQNDLLMLFDSYFAQDITGTPLSVISTKHIEIIRLFVAGTEGRTSTSHNQARHAVFLAQRQIEQEMEQDYADFQKSDLWFRAAKDLVDTRRHAPNQTDHSGADAISMSTPMPQSPTRRDTPPMGSDYGRSLEETRQLARTSLGTPPFLKHRPRSTFAESQQSIRSVTNLSLLMESERSPFTLGNTARTPLFGDGIDSSSISSQDMERNEQMLAIQAALGDIIDSDPSRVDGLAAEASSERQPMFPDSDDESFPTQLPPENIHETADGSIFNASGTLESNVQGHFELFNLIAQLDQKLESLRSQETMLDALIRKADLSGDVHKLPLLRKSKDAMDREMSELTFQKAQLEQQQAENSFVPGRTKACIISAAPEEEDGKSVIRYLIEVKQTGVDDTNVSGWVVARRYNEFLSMHQRLKDKHAAVRTLEFPGKSLVTSLSTNFVEARRIALEKYLQGLIDIPIICRSQELLEFLSRQSPTHVNSTASSSKLRPSLRRKPNLVGKVYKSVADSIDDMLYGPSMLDVMIQRLTSQAAGIAGIVGANVHDEDLVARAFQASAEASCIPAEDRLLQLSGGLTPFESETTNFSFSAPICNLLIAVFELDLHNNWLRRHATVLILQQVLGGAIERRFRDIFKNLTEESNLLTIITAFRDLMWPRGEFRPDSVPRTPEERSRTRHGANQKLSALMPDLVASMLGRSNARRGARRIFSVLQNRRLNQHLLYTILDEIVKEVFPEAKT